MAGLEMADGGSMLTPGEKALDPESPGTNLAPGSPCRTIQAKTKHYGLEDRFELVSP
jgi:hypothetical protein